MAREPRQPILSEARRRQRLEDSIRYLHDNLPKSLVTEYARIRLAVDIERQRANLLRRDARASLLRLMTQHEALPHGELETRSYRKTASRAADVIIENLTENDIFFMSLRAWQPYRQRQEKFFTRIHRASPTFLEEFQLHMNGLLQKQRRTLKLIRRETLVDFIIDRKSRNETVCLDDFRSEFKAATKTLPPLEG